METQGILFIAAGEGYIHSAIRSARTVHKYCPGLSTHLFADWRSSDFDFDKSPFPFTSVGRIDTPHRRSKVDYLSLTPFDQTLYLDNDSALNADIRSMFGVLDRFDIALAHVPQRYGREQLETWRTELPHAFPYYNSGVILYRKTPAVIQLLEDWRDCFKEAGLRRDETTLRELLWLSDLRVAVLSAEYNLRHGKYRYPWSKSDPAVKIYHMRQLHEGWLQRWFLRPLRRITRFK